MINNVKEESKVLMGKKKRSRGFAQKASYSPSDSRETIVHRLLSQIAYFKHNSDFSCHLEIVVETNFDFLNLTHFQQELHLQELLINDISKKLKQHSKFLKVVGYLSKGYYHYHYYLDNELLQAEELSELFTQVSMNYQRYIDFTFEEDGGWEEVTNAILDSKEKVFGFIEYLGA